MSSTGAGARGRDRNSVFTSLADGRRRRILGILLERDSAVTEADLAVAIAATEVGTSESDVPEDAARERRVHLVHCALPPLERAGLVVRDANAGTVATTDHPVFQDPTFERIVETDAAGWDAVLANLAHRRRRVALSVLQDEGSMDSGALAREVARLERDARRFERDARAPGDARPAGPGPEVGSSDREAALRAEFHHVHLPKLDEAGLVSYDAADGTVTYVGHPALEEEWLRLRDGDAPRAVLTDARRASDVWRIDGRDQVTERARALCDYAADELFAVFAADGLLEEATLRRIEAAVDRGVDVYVGTTNSTLRDRLRERVPGVDIWEPRTDSVTLPPDHRRVGRLVLADREAIMLGTRRETAGHACHDEVAVTGLGERNAVVMLVREAFGPRLAHVDARSADYLSRVTH